MSYPIFIKNLTKRFEEHKESYSSSSYNETQLRREFIDPFFKALGWDVDNEQGYAEAYKDVIHEDSIKIGGATKAPDYCFRIGGVRKFFVETKKPSINIKDDIHPAFQVRRYAWSAKLPLSILTDFEEFAVYDCREKPVKTDKASKGRILYLTYDQYESKWNEIEKVFSKESILKGSFDKYAESTKGKRGTSEVDNEFLIEIERWRELLARNIALRNPALTQRELNFAVQRTIDRIIFLRICEDRGIEHYGTLMALLNGEHVYNRMRQNFRKADEVYNSGLFHFRAEKGRAEPPDTLTLALQLDDKPLKDIIKNLYYPESPYEFAVLPSDILGQVYERFLGSVIRLTKGHQAKVEEKPEVKKAGGVFYTPTYIVDYIVNSTVGKLIEGKSPKQIEKIKILDPACGSGTFLIQAYQFLLDYHLDWYIKDGKEKISKGKNPKLTKVFSGEWRLSTGERKKILLNNIYGVDIDTQAVEVTKLSLLLKVLEGENEQSLAQQLSLFHERALPDLENNIKCGNSLISHDYFNIFQTSLFEEEIKYKINAFDWNTEFKNIKFNAIIGNPPYGSIFSSDEVSYLVNHYSIAARLKDSYPIFIQKCVDLLGKNGFFSFIVPSAFLGGPNYEPLRCVLISQRIESLILLPFDVFHDAYVDTTVFVLQKQEPSKSNIVKTFIYGKREKLKSINLSLDDYNQIEQSEWSNSATHRFVLDPLANKLLNQIRKFSEFTFANIIEIKRGVLFDKKYLTNSKISSISHPYFEGNIYRYISDYQSNNWIEFNDLMKEKPKDFYWFEGKRILLRRLVNRKQRLMASIIEKTCISNKNLYSVLPLDESFSLELILALINSRIMSYLYINRVSQASKDDFPQVTIKDILGLPFPKFKNKNIIKDIEKRTKTLIKLYSESEECRDEQSKKIIQRQILFNDTELDKEIESAYGVEFTNTNI